MEDKEKITYKDVGETISITFCPHCKSDKVWRILRSETEKIVCYLSDGKYAVKKYICQSCQQTTLLNRSDTQLANEFKIEDNLIVGLIPCLKCGVTDMQVGKVPVSEENNYNSYTGKTALKKLTCLNCNNEAIISKEDFEAFGNQEF